MAFKAERIAAQDFTAGFGETPRIKQRECLRITHGKRIGPMNGAKALYQQMRFRRRDARFIQQRVIHAMRALQHFGFGNGGVQCWLLVVKPHPANGAQQCFSLGPACEGHMFVNAGHDQPRIGFRNGPIA